MFDQRREDKRLFLAYRRSGDLAARDALIQRFLPLARSLARRYASGAEPLEDLEQVASLALIKAIDALRRRTRHRVQLLRRAVHRRRASSATSATPAGRCAPHANCKSSPCRSRASTIELSAASRRAAHRGQIAEHAGVDVEDVLERARPPARFTPFARPPEHLATRGRRLCRWTARRARRRAPAASSIAWPSTAPGHARRTRLSDCAPLLPRRAHPVRDRRATRLLQMHISRLAPRRDHAARDRDTTVQQPNQHSAA